MLSVIILVRNRALVRFWRLQEAFGRLWGGFLIFIPEGADELEAMEFVFLNNCLIDANNAQISIYDTAVMHGIGLFETMRLCNGRVFRLEDHLDRLYRSAEILAMNITVARDELVKAIELLIEANNLGNKDGRLKLTITPGNIREVSDSGLPNNSVIITASPYPSDRPQAPSVLSTIITQYRINDDEPGAGHKTLNYFNRLTMLQQAHREGYGEALCFSVRGLLCGGCLSNIFLVKSGQLITPALSRAIVPGITRKTVIELAGDALITVKEENISSQLLMEADEIFLTNTSMGIVPVGNIGNHKVGDGDIGVITGKIIEKYQEEIGRK